MSVGNKKNEKAQSKLASFVRAENMSLVVDGRPARVHESIPFLAPFRRDPEKALHGGFPFG